MKSRIKINDLELPVLLGWLPEERSQAQTVKIDIQIHFRQPPQACTTDDLMDTFCYDSLIRAIKTKTADREFRLIEYLAQEIFQICKNNLLPDLTIGVRVTKKPPILNVNVDVSFCYGDEDCCIW